MAKDDNSNQYVWPEPAPAAKSSTPNARELPVLPQPTLVSSITPCVSLPQPEPHIEQKPVLATIPAPPQAPAPSPGSIILGKYELIHQIASGGMGRVFRARHVQLRMPLAIKIMHDFIAANPEHTERFRREALALSKLNHPNVVRIVDFGKLDNTLFLVMEYVAGQSLSSYILCQRDPASLDAIKFILTQLLDALIALHDTRIIHRDLKPHNVLISQDSNDQLLVKVVDLGLARYRDAAGNETTLTQADAVAGTPAYMSPEQCRSLHVTHSTDLYAFGCILTELLQKKPPFVGGSVADTISMHLFAPVKPLNRPPGAEPVPPALEQLRHELLAKLPEGRPRDARIVKERLLSAFSAADVSSTDLVRGTPDRGAARESRVPMWNRVPRVSPGAAPGQGIVAGLAIVEEEPHALDEVCITGLLSQGIGLEQVELQDEMSEIDALILDCSSNAAVAVSWTRRLRAAHPKLWIVVCVIGLNSSLLNELVEAGADDVTRGGVGSDVLGRKLNRLVGKTRSPT